MDVSKALRTRRMTRSFAPTALPPGLVDRLLDDALRAPTAGHTRGTAWLVLTGPGQTDRYWTQATTADWRARSARYRGLARAPVVALSLSSPDAYVARYGEADKAASGLGPEGGAEAWPVPYWHTDAAFSTMALLLGSAAAGLGAAFLGNFRQEAALLGSLGVPEDWRLFGAVVLGHPDGADHRSPSLARPGPDRTRRIHHGRWHPPEG
jgi:nitroreductase